MEIGTIRSKDIEEKGLLAKAIIVEEFQNTTTKEGQKPGFVEVSFDVGKDDKWEDKILKLPLKFQAVSIWGARMNHEPKYLGVFSYGKWYFSGMLQYQVVRNPNQMEQLDIFLSIEGRVGRRGEVHGEKGYAIHILHGLEA